MVRMIFPSYRLVAVSEVLTLVEHKTSDHIFTIVLKHICTQDANCTYMYSSWKLLFYIKVNISLPFRSFMLFKSPFTTALVFIRHKHALDTGKIICQLSSLFTLCCRTLCHIHVAVVVDTK